MGDTATTSANAATNTDDNTNIGDNNNTNNTGLNTNMNHVYTPELRLAEPEPFFGLDTEDPEAWLRKFHQCSRVNRWANWARKRDYLAFYLRDEAARTLKTQESSIPNKNLKLYFAKSGLRKKLAKHGSFNFSVDDNNQVKVSVM
jgi:hypothetical protein